MWNLFLRLGMALSTLFVAREAVDRLFRPDLRPARLYRPREVASYLGTTVEQVLELTRTGDLRARWLGGEPMILGAAVIEFLMRPPDSSRPGGGP